MINTFDMTIWFRNENGQEYTRSYYNISRRAMAYFLGWHRQNPDYECHGSYMR